MGFSKLFGKKNTNKQSAQRRNGNPLDYGPFVITPSPLPQGSTWNVAGTIQHKTSGDSHDFIRADTHSDWDQACDHSLQKGKQIIDEQGDRLFAATTS